jgi:MFS family permease
MLIHEFIKRLIRQSDPISAMLARIPRTRRGVDCDVKSPGARSAWLLYALAPLVTYITPVYMALLAARLPMSDQQIGLLAGVESFGGVIAALSARWWINRVNWRVAAASALIVMIVGIMLTALTTSFTILFAIRALTSIFGDGPLLVIAIITLSSSAEPDRNFAFAFATQLVIGLAVLVLLPMIDAMGGWHGVVALLAVCFAFALPLTRHLPPCSADPVALSASATSLSVHSWLLLLSIALLSASTQAAWAFSEVLGRTVGMSIDGMSHLLVGSTLLAVIGSLAAAPVAIKLGRRSAFIGGAAITLASIAPLYFALGIPSYVSYYLIGACATAFIAPLQLGALAQHRDGPAAASLTPALQAAGMMIGPAAVGLTSTGTHSPLLAVTVAVMFLVSSIPAFTFATRVILR